jgi:hypothetical protein
MKAALFVLTVLLSHTMTNASSFKVYVSNESGTISVISDANIYLYSISDTPASSLRALQVAPNGHLYAASYGTSQVLNFAADDSFVESGATGQYTQAPGSNPLAGRDCGLTELYAFDDGVPGSGAVTFSLITGVASGVESSLGTNSVGVPRANANPCP